LALKTPLKTNRIHHNIRGVKMTPASRWRNKIELPVEGLIEIPNVLCCKFRLKRGQL